MDAHPFNSIVATVLRLGGLLAGQKLPCTQRRCFRRTRTENYGDCVPSLLNRIVRHCFHPESKYRLIGNMRLGIIPQIQG